MIFWVSLRYHHGRPLLTARRGKLRILWRSNLDRRVPFRFHDGLSLAKVVKCKLLA